VKTFSFKTWSSRQTTVIDGGMKSYTILATSLWECGISQLNRPLGSMVGNFLASWGIIASWRERCFLLL